jgi:eukaryotic-like serine/threonine-protein kinase
MSVTGPMVLQPDLIIVRGSEVAEETRLQCSCAIDDYVVTRPRSRTHSRVVNKQVAELLELFREPTTIIEAVLSLCLKHGTSADSTLDRVFAALTPFLEARWLVSPESQDRSRIEPSLRPGDIVGGYRILDCRHFLEDTEVYYASTAENGFAALKIARHSGRPGLESAFMREARVLRFLDGNPAPRFLSEGTFEGRPYIAMTWCLGMVISQAASELCQLEAPRIGSPILHLSSQILHAYVTLHGKGVIHGDVYPKNILVDSTGRVSVVDYGFACFFPPRGDSFVSRRGVPEFFEPELAAAALSETSKPIASFAGEQYSLAVLVYYLIVGKHYIRFSARREVMLGQIVAERPLTFAEQGVPAWPKLETVLRRALDKNPDRRFPTVAEFVQALNAADRHEVTGTGCGAPRAQALEMSTELISRLNGEDRNALAEFPKCSITYGAAGVAYGLYAVACARGDAELLTSADAWATRAAKISDQFGAFTNDGLDFEGVGINHNSVYYGRPGVYLVQALIAQAMGDEASLIQALRGYVSACLLPDECLDLTLGLAGTLTGCAFLRDAVRPSGWQVNIASVLPQLAELAHAIINRFSLLEKEGSFGKTGYLGIAHGLAGTAYAALLWSEVSGESPPAYVLRALDTLFYAAQDYGRGVRWPTKVDIGGSSGYMESWCHGTPGYVHLWTTAFRAFGEPRFLEISERAAWTIWEAPESMGSLCCGDAGRAYALLNLGRHTGDRAWTVRAMELARRAAACRFEPQTAYSLFKGALGPAILIEDLKQPERASFPLFEREFRGSAQSLCAAE